MRRAGLRSAQPWRSAQLRRDSHLLSHRNTSITSHYAFSWNQTPGPMIIPGPEVTMATAPAKSPSLPSQPNPVQIRYEHHTEELNPVRVTSQKQRLCDKLAATHSVRSDSRLKLTLQTSVLQTSCRLHTKCLLSVSLKKEKRKNGGYGWREERKRGKKRKWCQIPRLPNPTRWCQRSSNTLLMQ